MSDPRQLLFGPGSGPGPHLSDDPLRSATKQVRSLVRLGERLREQLLGDIGDIIDDQLLSKIAQLIGELSANSIISTYDQQQLQRSLSLARAADRLAADRKISGMLLAGHLVGIGYRINMSAPPD